MQVFSAMVMSNPVTEMGSTGTFVALTRFTEYPLAMTMSASAISSSIISSAVLKMIEGWRDARSGCSRNISPTVTCMAS